MEETGLISTESQAQVNNWLQYAGEQETTVKDLTINTNLEFQNCDAIYKKIRQGINEIEKTRVKEKNPHLNKGREIDKYFKGIMKPLETIKQVCGKAIRQWEIKENERRRIVQTKLDKEAALIRQKEQEKAEKNRLKAQEYSDKGKDEMAQNALQKASEHEENSKVYIPSIVDTPLKTSVRKTKVLEITIEDQGKALRFVLDNPVYFDFGLVKFDEAKVKKLYKDTKGKMAIDGIKYEEKEKF